MNNLDLAELNVNRLRNRRRHAWQSKPLVRLWANPPDGEEDRGLILRGIASDSLSGSFRFTRNGVTAGVLKLRLDHFLARWLISIPNDKEAKKNVVVTVDHMGGELRWSGLLKNWQVKKDGRGIYYMEATFIDDRQYLQFLLGAPNPILPIPLFQFPRVLPGWGPSRWIVSFFILINLMRVNSNLWNLPDDPFNWDSWADGFDMSTWQCFIVAPSLLQDSSLWGVIGTRMDTMETVIKEIMDMGQLTMEYRRIITDDGEDPADFGLDYVDSVRNGALVLKVVDNSGYYDPSGTAFDFGLGVGFIRSAVEFANGFVEEYVGDAISDDESIWPDEYYQENSWLKGWLPVPTRPCYTFRDSKWSQIETSTLGWSPAGPVAVCVGGDNPYVDMLIDLTIKAVGDIVGYFALATFSSAGELAAAAIMPFLKGTVLAWLYWKNVTRAQNLGWAHLMEMRATSGDSNVWSVSSIGALTGSFSATKSTSTHQLTVSGAGPLYPGIHVKPGYRFASTAERIIPGFTHVDAVESMDLSWDYTQPDKGHKYAITIGTNEVGMSFAERFAKSFSKAWDVISQIGVRLM